MLQKPSLNHTICGFALKLWAVVSPLLRGEFLYIFPEVRIAVWMRVRVQGWSTKQSSHFTHLFAFPESSPYFMRLAGCLAVEAAAETVISEVFRPIYRIVSAGPISPPDVWRG